MKTKMTNLLFLNIFLVFLINNTGSISISDMKVNLSLDSHSLKKLLSENSMKLENALKSKNLIQLEKNEITDTASLSNLISPNFKANECDLVTDGPICLYNGEKVILPQARHKNLIGYWNFEESRILDNSGLRNHAINVVKPGPAFGGIGSSGYFTNGDYVEVPHTKAFITENFSISFWMFIIQDFFTASKGIRYCPLIQKGKDDLFSKKYNRFPSIYFDRRDKYLKINLKTVSNKTDDSEGESFISKSKINTQRWMHVSMTKNDKKMKLYINGILDTFYELNSGSEKNEDSLFIGGAPWFKDECDYPFLIDELRYYNEEIEKNIIEAEAAPALGGIEPNFINLGCNDCSLKMAAESCKDEYRLCSTLELHTAGYQVARSMGWLSWNTHIWTNSALESPKNFEKFKGLAICCLQNK